MQVIQDAFKDQLNKEESDSQLIFKEDSSLCALNAIYKHLSLNVICGKVYDLAQNATSTSITLIMNLTRGELATDHFYSIFSCGDLFNDQPTLILHNSWEFIKEKDGWGDPILWGSNISDLDHSSFQISMFITLLQCVVISYLDLN